MPELADTEPRLNLLCAYPYMSKSLVKLIGDHYSKLRFLLDRGVVLAGTPIWLQPLSLSPAATERAMAACAKHGYRLSLQTHRFVGCR